MPRRGMLTMRSKARSSDRLAHQPQIGERVADLLALVEARAADHAIRQRQCDEALLEFAGLKAGAHQDRDLLQRVLLAVQCLDFIADPARLLLGVPHPAHQDLVALSGAGPERLAEAAAIVRDDPGRGSEDLRRRAVILLQPHDQRAREIALEPQDVADLGAAPAVDRLVVVADAAQIAVMLRQQPQPQILRDIGVLVLVDQQIAKAPLIGREDLGVGAEQRQIVQQKVAEIDRVHGCEAFLIGAVQRHRAAVGDSRRHPPPAPCRG